MLSAFEHATSRRDRTDNLVCEVELDSGAVGFGEGGPRRPVTGETVESCWQAVLNVAAGTISGEVGSFDEAVRLARRVTDELPDGPGVLANAARAAIELALLDAFGRAYGTSILPTLARVAGRPDVPGSPRLSYSMVIGRELAQDREGLAALHARYGYRAAKLKVGFGQREDLETVARVREVLGAQVDLRLDANRALDLPDAISLMREVRALGVTVIEDPIRGETVEHMAEGIRTLRQETGAQVVLDEPMRTRDEVERAIALGAIDVASVRVSKCGGLLRSCEIAAACRAAGVGVQLGCQVGETAVLSAAGRHLACAVGDLRFLEGSNEELKFAPGNFICAENLTYGAGGVGRPLTGPGLGLTIDRPRLARLSMQQAERVF